MSPLVNLGFGATMLSAIFILWILLHIGPNYHLPSVPLPPEVVDAYPELEYGSMLPKVNEKTPWGTDRSRVRCLAPNCNKSAGYVSELEIEGTIFLTTQVHFLTGNPVTYPAATVLEMKSNAKSKSYYVVDAQPSEGVVAGLLPLVKYNGEPLDMSVKMNLDVPVGRNLTGDYANSFVIINSTPSDIYMPTTRVGQLHSYWKLIPGSHTLMWPSERYFNKNSEPVGLHTWNASMLPSITYEQAASIAEITMYTALRPKAELPSQ